MLHSLRHRPAVIAASAAAVLAAATAIPLAVSASELESSTGVDSAVTAPSTMEVRALTSGAAEAIEQRDA